MILNQVEKLTNKNFVYLFLGIVVAGLISFLSPASTPETPIFVFLSGSIAITATILPGISGSFILLLLSKYEFIINAIKSFDLQILSVFALGCILGLIILAEFYHLCLQILRMKYYLYFPVSCGSLIKIWPFRNVLESRVNSEGELEAVVTRPELPNATNVEEIIFFLVFYNIWICNNQFFTKEIFRR